MYDDTDSPKSVLDGQDARGQTSGLSFSATPPRFGRLAMCVAAASALAIGVMGTVAYSVWFNHDQQAYAEAMAGARRALMNRTGGQFLAGTRFAGDEHRCIGHAAFVDPPVQLLHRLALPHHAVPAQRRLRHDRRMPQAR